MRTFTLSIETETDSFEDCGDEIARILTQAAADIGGEKFEENPMDGSYGMPICDSKGRQVGHAIARDDGEAVIGDLIRKDNEEIGPGKASWIDDEE